MRDYNLKSNDRKVYEPSDADWLEVEKRTGYCFSEDYKFFIQRYGAYSLAEFLWILSPYEENQYLNLQKREEEARKAFTLMKEEIDDLEQYKLFDGTEGLYLFGVTENGDELYWNVSDRKAADEIYVFESRSYVLEKYTCGFKDFIMGLISRSINISFFPEDIEY